jgi:hypothetical protein
VEKPKAWAVAKRDLLKSSSTHRAIDDLFAESSIEFRRVIILRLEWAFIHQ